MNTNALRNDSIQCIGFTSRPLIEKVKEHLLGRTAVSDHIVNCNDCKNEKLSANNFKILKQCKKYIRQVIFTCKRSNFDKCYSPILNNN